VNTPAHALVNLAVLAGGKRPADARWVLLGAVLPDAPMLVFFMWESLFQGHAQALLWNELYFEDRWQDFFDVFNSIPLAALGLAIGFALRRTSVILVFASVLLHCALDLPLHHDDGHRHFFPLSDWRFESPISYWDPRRFGAWGALAETLAVLAASAVLWRRTAGRGFRFGVGLFCVIQVVGYLAMFVW